VKKSTKKDVPPSVPAPKKAARPIPKKVPATLPVKAETADEKKKVVAPVFSKPSGSLFDNTGRV